MADLDTPIKEIIDVEIVTDWWNSLKTHQKFMIKDILCPDISLWLCVMNIHILRNAYNDKLIFETLPGW